ncbi:MAG: ACT domain-containing protein [Bdellovibrionales bacterium]
MKLEVSPYVLAVCQLPPHSEIPTWATKSDFYSISKTTDELSIVCEQSFVPAHIKSEKDWRLLKVVGPLDFGLTGILAFLLHPLAEAKISIFALSTFDTDYLLVKQNDFDSALNSLTEAGHTVLTK